MNPAQHPFTVLLRDAAAIVDVRAPGEFARGAVFGAVNIPLFSDDERAEMSGIYRLHSWSASDVATGQSGQLFPSRILEETSLVRARGT